MAGPIRRVVFYLWWVLQTIDGAVCRADHKEAKKRKTNVYYFRTQTYMIYPTIDQAVRLKELMFNAAYLYNKCLKKRQTLYELHGDDEPLAKSRKFPTRDGFVKKMEKLLPGMMRKIVAQADEVADKCITDEKPFPPPMGVVSNRTIDISDCPKSLKGTDLDIQNFGVIKTCRHEEITQGSPVRWTVFLDPRDRWMLRLLVRSTSPF